MYKIAITTGDLKGIGEEVVIKALKKLNLDKKDVIVIGKKILDYDYVDVPKNDNGKFCFECLKIASDMANNSEIKAIVTAPVSKEELHKSGYKFNGQTEVLEYFLGDEKNKAEMLFISRDLRVMLLTRHVPLNKIKIDLDMIIEKTLRLNSFLSEKLKIKKPKIAICTLNPHGGENGILGDFEIKTLNPAILKLQKMNIDVKSCVADALFSKVGKKYQNCEKQEYDAIIAMYHDQGLCPVKALCFNEVVNTTIGLKVIRTSPSHGTACDIFNKNLADETSMMSAIKLAIQLSK